MKGLWMGIICTGLGIFLTSCVVSEEEFTAQQQQLDSLQYELVIEQRLNDQLQRYIETVCYPKIEPGLRRTSLGDLPPVSKVSVIDSLPKLKLRKIHERPTYRLDVPIRFTPGSSDLSEASLDLLLPVADTLRAFDNLLIMVIGHTDNTEKGDDPTYVADGWDLSTRRANEVVRYLISMGVPPHQLMASGQSMFRPLASNRTQAGQELNRHVEILISPLDQ